MNIMMGAVLKIRQHQRYMMSKGFISKQIAAVPSFPVAWLRNEYGQYELISQAWNEYEHKFEYLIYGEDGDIYEMTEEYREQIFLPWLEKRVAENGRNNWK